MDRTSIWPQPSLFSCFSSVDLVELKQLTLQCGKRLFCPELCEFRQCEVNGSFTQPFGKVPPTLGVAPETGCAA
jgi:hypothetical protein